MNPTWKASLIQAATLTFESMCFLFPDVELDTAQHLASPVDATAGVEFRGILHGGLQITLYGNLLPQLAANMLGQDQLPAQHLQLEALGEVANVTCGHLLPQLVGPSEVFQIGAPQLFTGWDMTIYPSMICMADVPLGLEQGRAELKVYIGS